MGEQYLEGVDVIFQNQQSFRSYDTLGQAFKTNLKSQICYPRNHVPLWECDVGLFSQFRALIVSVKGIKFYGGGNMLRAVHLSQPITRVLLWTTAVNNFFKFQKSFLLRYLHRTKHEIIVTISTFTEDMWEMEYCFILSLLNQQKFAKRGLELDIKRSAYVSSQAQRTPGW